MYLSNEVIRGVVWRAVPTLRLIVMKKLFLASAGLSIALASLTAAPAAAQTVFAPMGAEWWYDVQSMHGPGVAFAYVDSSLVGPSSTVQRIKRTIFWQVLGTTSYTTQPMASLYVQQQGDVVVSFSTAGGFIQQTPFLDFGQTVGDVRTEAIECPQDSMGVIRIDSVGTVTSGAMSLRSQTATARSLGSGMGPITPFYEFAGKRIERLGHLHAFVVPQGQCGTDPDYYTLQYYVDPTMSFGVRPSIRVTGMAETAATAALSVAPNPSASGRFRVEGVTGATTYAVFDAQGRRVRAGELSSAPEVDLTDVPAGLYLLRGEVGGQAFTRRLLVR